MKPRLLIVGLALAVALSAAGQVRRPTGPPETLPPLPDILISQIRTRTHGISQMIQANRLEEADRALTLSRAELGPHPLFDGMEGFLLYRRHQFDRSIEILRAAVETPQAPVWWRVLLAMNYAALGQSTEANREYQKAIRIDPRGTGDGTSSMAAAALLDTKLSPTVPGFKGLLFILESAGNRGQILRSLAEGTKSLPKEPWIRAAFLRLAGPMAEPKLFGSEAEKAVKDFPNDAAIYMAIASVHLGRKEYDQGLVFLQKAVDLDANNAPAALTLGQTLMALGKLPEAEARLVSLLHHQDAEIAGQAWAHVGEVQSRAKRWSEAANTLEKGVAAQPENAILLNNLSWLYATAEDTAVRNPKRAVELGEKAVQLTDGRNAALLDTLAEAYYVSGDKAKAIEHLRKALALAPSRADLRERLQKYEAK
jgi:tetratricopeptide (TPR) repeat protein